MAYCVKPGILQVYVDCAFSWFPGPTLLLTSQLVRSKLGSSAMDRCLIVVLFVFIYTAKRVKTNKKTKQNLIFFSFACNLSQLLKVFGHASKVIF